MSVTFKDIKRHFERGRPTAIRMVARVFLVYYSFASIYKYHRESENDNRDNRQRCEAVNKCDDGFKVQIQCRKTHFHELQNQNCATVLEEKAFLWFNDVVHIS